MTQAEARRITATYAYHPAEMKADLTIPTDAVAHYATHRPGPLRGDFQPLEFSIRNDGVRQPLRIATDGVWGVLTDGHHRLRIARQLGVKKLPVQVVPDNMRRMSYKYGRAALEPFLAEWIPEHLWVHTTHEVIRRRVGSPSPAGGIVSSTYLRCDCSCGANWKEETE
jgi:hypothetical protein